MAELKPCPFCGRIPMVEDCGDNRFFVRCKCGIAQDKLYGQRCDAVRRWNTRKPSVDVPQRKRGEWEFYEDRSAVDIIGKKTWARAYKCSECGFIHAVIEDFGIYSFCPRCGARMDGDTDE